MSAHANVVRISKGVHVCIARIYSESSNKLVAGSLLRVFNPRTVIATRKSPALASQ